MTDAPPADRIVATVHDAPLRPGDGLRLDGHAHAWVDPPAGVAAPDEVALRDEARIRAGLTEFAGLASPRRAAAIDCQPPGAGRDARALARLSAASGVAIAATTGFHLARYYPHGARPWSTVGAARDAFVADLQVGLAELPGRLAAVIKAADTGAAATGRDGADAGVWAAALEARAACDALLLIHTERGADASGLLGWLLDRGVPAERVYLCHVDKRPDPSLHAELARAGALLGYDTFLRGAYDPERTTWPLVARMLEEGLAGSIAIGLDLASAAMWPAAAGSEGGDEGSERGPVATQGPAGLLRTVLPHLQALGARSHDVDDLLGGSLLRRAARPDPAAGAPTPPVPPPEEPR